MKAVKDGKVKPEGFKSRIFPAEKINKLRRARGKLMMAMKKLMMAKHRAERVDVDGIYIVIFDFDSAKLNVESQRVLRKVAAAFKMAKPTGRTMTGHGDLSGASDYNAALTRRRLDAVLGFLLEKGMPSIDLIPSTHGEKKALVPTKDGMREKRNRRGGYLPIGRFSELVTIEEKRARGHGGGSGLNYRLMSHASFFALLLPWLLFSPSSAYSPVLFV